MIARLITFAHKKVRCTKIMVWKVVLRLQLAIFGMLRCCFGIVDMLSNLSLHQNVDPIFLGDSGVTYGAVPHPRTLRYPNLAMETLHVSYVDQINPFPHIECIHKSSKIMGPKKNRSNTDTKVLEGFDIKNGNGRQTQLVGLPRQHERSRCQVGRECHSPR